MQVTLTPEDLDEAPAEVTAWIASRFCYANPPEDPKPGTPEQVANAVAAVEAVANIRKPDAEPAKATPSMDEVKAAATSYVESQGVGAIKEILADMDLGKVTECPDERLADLLARLAVS